MDVRAAALRCSWRGAWEDVLSLQLTHIKQMVVFEVYDLETLLNFHVFFFLLLEYFIFGVKGVYLWFDCLL